MPGTRRLTAFRISGTLYVHYRKEGLFRLTDLGPELVIRQSLIGPEDLGAILAIDAESDYWLLATGTGIVKYHDGKSEPFAPAVSELLRKDWVTCGVRLPDGRCAFGTVLDGIIFMRPDGTIDRQVRESDGLPSPYISSLFLDRQGGLWVTSSAHVVRLNLDSTSRLFDERANLAASVYYHIGKSDSGITVVNTIGAFALDENQRQFTRLTNTSTIHDLNESPSGLIVSGYRGASLMRAGKMTPVYQSNSDVFTAFASHSHEGELYVAVDSRPAIVDVKRDGSSRTIVNNLPTLAYSIAEDQGGYIWMGTQRGIFRARYDATRASSAEAIAGKLGLPAISGAVTVRSTHAGAVLVLSDSGAWFKPATASNFAPVKNWPSRSFVAVSEFGPENVAWVIHSATETLAPAVGKIIAGPGGARWSPLPVSGLDAVGTPFSIFADSDTAGQPVLWIGGNKAVLRHVVASKTVATEPRSPILQAFVRPTFRSSLQPITSLLPYSTAAVEFQFAEPDYANRGLLRLQTRIDGIDSDWVPAPSNARRDLTAIRDGKYTFRVRAVAETGVASEPSVFSFEVAPPWWRTMPAVLSEIAAGLILAYSCYRLRVRSLRRRNVQLEEKVRKRTEELAEASAAKTQFVANMSHDIRNPLNGIVGLALALEDSRLDPQQRELVATLRECTTYLSSLVDDVLDFATIEAGRVELRSGPFVPAELLNSVVTTLKGETARRGSFVTIETDPDIPQLLRGDAGRIQQILVNFLSNALKYAGGHIRLAATMPANAPGEVEFSVSDEGPGISAADQKTLFTKFSRLTGARRDNIPGTGLGLASCRLLADIMGGAVDVESQLGAGARFILRLPLAAAAAEPAPVPANIALPQTNILLVEDTDYNALAAKAVLGKLGLTCDRARDGTEALQMFQARRYNVVLLDRNLPDLDGIEVARQMRELETDGLRCVMLAVTAYCTADDRARCLAAGMDAFLGKPLTPDKLRKALVEAGRKLLGASSIEAPPVKPAGPIDTTLLEYLSDGTTAGLGLQAERFGVALEQAHARLVTTLSGGNLRLVGDAAHQILGHARMIGAAELCDAAVAVETAARNSDAPAASAGMPLLAAQIDAVMAALRRYRPGVPKA
ncbi:MAG TPA: ATP-binding protein [Opitutaceae bacterium]|nr:ATP-binding protein [Opitutaceae bacterium]